jgi:predicted dienelactone hydrolase
MYVRVVLAFAVVGCLIFSSDSTFADEWTKPGRFKVATEFGQWNDLKRDEREIPFKVYAPVGDQDRLPIVLFSHGGGGNREGNSLLGNHLASHGFVCIHLQHIGTDDRAFRRSPRSIRDAANDPKVCADRFRDVAFAVKQIEVNNVTQKLRGKLDPSRVGISGHSLGGITTQVIAGQHVQGFDQEFCMPKLRGAVILSPSPPRPGFGDSATAFRNMKLPMLSITGTADVPPDKSFLAKDRRVPFDRTENVEQWLLVLEGATHFTFSGNTERPRIAALLPGMEADPNMTANHSIMKAATLAFWRWTLLDDEDGKSFLNHGLADAVRQRGHLERKPKASPNP